MKKQKKDIVKKLSKKIEKTKVNIKSKEEKQRKKEEKQQKRKKNKVLIKTIELVETIVYILAIIIAIFANLYGNIYIQMIPILFILGIVGKIVFNRPVTTTVFGMIVAVCAVYITGIRSIPKNLIISSWMAAYIALGELCAFAFSKSWYYIKKKKSSSKEACGSYLLLIITLIVSIGVYNYTNSNIFDLQKARKRLDNYLVQNYSDSMFRVSNVRYNFLGEKSFEFYMENIKDGKIYNFLVSKDEKYDIDDGYNKLRNINKEKNINENLIKYFTDNKLNEKYEGIKVSIELNEVDNFEFKILKEVSKDGEDINDDDILKYSKEIAMLINDLKNFEYLKNFQQIIISIKNNENTSQNITSYLNIEKFFKDNSFTMEHDYEYIKNALNVEYIN